MISLNPLSFYQSYLSLLGINEQSVITMASQNRKTYLETRFEYIMIIIFLNKRI